QGIELRHPPLEDDEPASREGRDDGVGDLEPAAEVADLDRPADLEQRPEHPVLLLPLLLLLEEREVLRAVSVRDPREEDRARPRLDLERSREGGRERFTPGAGVLLRDPARELEERRVEDRLAIEDAQERLDPPRVDRRLRTEARDDADFAPAAE